MNVEETVKGLEQQIQTLQERIAWLRKHEVKLAALPVGVMCGTNVDFDNLPHKDVIAVVRMLGGKWKKTPSHNAERIDYAAEVDGVHVRCWQGEPPPSCKIVEIEEVVPAVTIPASVRKVRKMVCSPALAATIAHAAARAEVQP